MHIYIYVYLVESSLSLCCGVGSVHVVEFPKSSDIYMYMYVCIWMYTYMYVNIYIPICMYLHIYIHMYVCGFVFFLAVL